MPQSMVHIENLVKRYGDLTALNHLELDIREGEIFGLLGPNGSGKTTAINCILSLLRPLHTRQETEKRAGGGCH